jgi:hypothetical protein
MGTDEEGNCADEQKPEYDEENDCRRAREKQQEKRKKVEVQKK